MFDQFIEKLVKLLDQYHISEQDKLDIIEDYKQMIEDGKEKELTPEQIMDLIGSPEKIVSELGLHKKEKVPGGEKLIALSPFISLIIYLILGFTKNLWHPGWLVFLLIPIVAIIVEMTKDNDNHILTALSPFISGAFFFIVGFKYDIWHPTWLVFIIIPLFGIIESKKGMDNLTFFTALAPFISFIAFILIGYYTNAYDLAWLVLLLVVFLGLMHENNKAHVVLLILSLIVSIGGYVYIDLYYDNWQLGLLSFLLFLITGMLTGHIHIMMGEENTLFFKVLLVISSILFVGIGYFFDLWAVSWLVFLSIPVAAIIKYEKEHRLTAISPFVSLTIFMFLGYFFNLWYICWTVFLLIPMVAILEEKS